VNDIMLDTTYILPILGIQVKLQSFTEIFPKLLSHYRLLYNPISIAEAKWIVLKIFKETRNRNLLKRFRIGLTSLLNDQRLEQTILTDSEIEEVADLLLVRANVKDYFDRVIYATAVRYQAILLTEDQVLHSIFKRNDVPKPADVISWGKLCRDKFNLARG